MTNLLENVRNTANQIIEQPLENTFVPQDQDLGVWSSYLKKRLLAYPFVYIRITL